LPEGSTGEYSKSRIPPIHGTPGPIRCGLKKRTANSPRLRTWTARGRLQTVTREANPREWRLIREFGNLTGSGPWVLNTSFNDNHPSVCPPRKPLNGFPLPHQRLDVLCSGGRHFSCASPRYKGSEEPALISVHILFPSGTKYFPPDNQRHGPKFAAQVSAGCFLRRCIRPRACGPSELRPPVPRAPINRVYPDSP